MVMMTLFELGLALLSGTSSASGTELCMYARYILSMLVASAITKSSGCEAAVEAQAMHCKLIL